MQLIQKGSFTVDANLVRIGCLLHDIGVYTLLDADGKVQVGGNYVTHGIEGEKILEQEGFPEAISRFAAHHTGVGLSKQDVIEQKLPLPATDYLAETDEEELIMYADKFHSKTTPPYFNSFAWYKQDISQFGKGKAEKFEQLAQKFGLPDLESLSVQYELKIR